MRAVYVPLHIYQVRKGGGAMDTNQKLSETEKVCNDKAKDENIQTSAELSDDALGQVAGGHYRKTSGDISIKRTN
jgi:hypothetical protein